MFNKSLDTTTIVQKDYPTVSCEIRMMIAVLPAYQEMVAP